MRDAEITPILKQLIVATSLPFTAIETVFAVDSTNFGASRFPRWSEQKYRGRREHRWVKAHVMCGIMTNVVTAVEIHDRDTSDPTIFPLLATTTAQHFKIEEVLGDPAYASVEIHDLIAEFGATPYILFAKSHTGAAGGLWRESFLRFQLQEKEFRKHYHKRSNIETTFHMVKSKFRDHVRSTNDTGISRMNEVYCKFLCHNICCLIQANYELGINLDFSVERQAA